jgi:hypothetical protein
LSLRARSTIEALDAAGIPHCGMRLEGSTKTWCDFTAAVAHA